MICDECDAETMVSAKMVVGDTVVLTKKIELLELSSRGSAGLHAHSLRPLYAKPSHDQSNASCLRANMRYERSPDLSTFLPLHTTVLLP